MANCRCCNGRNSSTKRMTTNPDFVFPVFLAQMQQVFLEAGVPSQIESVVEVFADLCHIKSSYVRFEHAVNAFGQQLRRAGRAPTKRVIKIVPKFLIYLNPIKMASSLCERPI